MPTTIDQLQIEVETKSEKAEQGLKKLQATLQRLNKVAQSSGLDVTCKRLEKIASINFSNLSPLSKIAQATKPLQDVNKKIQNMTDSVAKMPSDLGMTVDVGGISDWRVDRIGFSSVPFPLFTVTITACACSTDFTRHISESAPLVFGLTV